MKERKKERKKERTKAKKERKLRKNESKKEDLILAYFYCAIYTRLQTNESSAACDQRRITKEFQLSYAKLNRYVLRRDLNMLVSVMDLISIGKPFHAAGPA